MAIVKKNRNTVSLLNSEPQQEMAELVDPQIDFLVSQGTIFSDDRSLVRLKMAPLAYPISDIDHLDHFNMTAHRSASPACAKPLRRRQGAQARTRLLMNKVCVDLRAIFHEILHPDSHVLGQEAFAKGFGLQF